MATPSKGSTSTYSNQNTYRPYNSSRGRGQNRGRGGNRGYRGFTYTGRSNENNRSGGNSQHGDMKTGLFKDSFLEDPWKEFILNKKAQSEDSNKRQAMKQEGDVPKDRSDEEGEIILSEGGDDDDFRDSKDDDGVVELGDGILEAVRGLT